MRTTTDFPRGQFELLGRAQPEPASLPDFHDTGLLNQLLAALAALNGAPDERQFWEAAAAGLAAVCATPACTLYEAEAEQFLARVRVGVLVASEARLSDVLGPVRKALASGAVVRFLWPGEPGNGRNHLLLPWHQAGRLGGLALLTPHAPIPEERLAAGRFLLQQTAVVLQRLRAWQAAERRAEQMQALHESGRSLSARLALHEALHALLATLPRAFATFRHANIFLYDGQQLAFGAAAWAENEPRRAGN